MYVVANILANSINATLISLPFAKQRNVSVQYFPSIMPYIQTYESSGLNLDYLWRKYQQPNRDYYEDLFLLRRHPNGFNFAYCEIPRNKLQSPWNLDALSEAFDVYVWGILVISIIALSITIYFKTVGLLDSKLFSPGKFLSGIFTSFISSLSALVTPGVSLLFVQNVKINNVVFILWMFVCIIIVNYYTGSVTSLMIVPPSEDAMTFVSQAVKRNYTLVFDDANIMRILNGTVRNMTEGRINKDHIMDMDEMDLRAIK